MSVMKSPPRADPRQTSAPAAKPAAEPQIEEKKVRELTEKIAYEFYEKRGGAHGRDLDDWFAAEKTAREQLSRPQA